VSKNLVPKNGILDLPFLTALSPPRGNDSHSAAHKHAAMTTMLPQKEIILRSEKTKPA
jgi:hypothetical protein